MTRELPPFLRELLTAPPRAGEGVHHWLFQVARQLHAHLPAGEIVALLETRVAHCGRSVPRNEIVQAVQNALLCAWEPRGHAAPVKPSSRWPAVDGARVESIVKGGSGLADLWEASPIRIGDSAAHTEEIIDRLFPGNPMLCCGRSKSQFETKPRDDWRGELAQLQLIVPSPMTAQCGRRKEDGQLSAHTLDNTGLRRFLIVECDFSIYARDGKTETQFAPLIKGLSQDGFEVADICAAVLVHLATFAPMVCAVHSGGKSLHGWFYVAGHPEEKVAKFFRYAVSLGADHATWSRSQFVRMPDGTRDNGKRQTVFFLSFKPLEAGQ